MTEANFKIRNSNRIAETKAEKYLKEMNFGYLRYGLDHLDSELPIFKIDPFVRSAPDYIVFYHNGNPTFFEAKGFVGLVKLKLRDLHNYKKWNDYLNIIFFLYDVKNSTYCKISFFEIVRIIKETSPDIKSYPENINNKYYEINLKNTERGVEWYEMPPERTAKLPKSFFNSEVIQMGLFQND